MIDARPAMTYAEMKAMYPDLNERGLANYLALETRTHTAEFEAERVARKARGECLLQPDIRGGKPWTGWCLTHDVADSMDHHFSVHPGAYND